MEKHFLPLGAYNLNKIYCTEEINIKKQNYCFRTFRACLANIGAIEQSENLKESF